MKSAPRPTTIAGALLIALAARSMAGQATTSKQQPQGFGPGARVLLDAHNAYPERGLWTDRINRALATGTPVAIEQDLYWAKSGNRDSYTSVVAHDSDFVVGAPTFQAHFFERIRPVMEQALRDNRRDTWPLIVLNLDFKDTQAAHLDYVWSLLGQYEQWLTTAPRTPRRERVEPFSVGPLLVLTGSDSAQRQRFYDAVPVGAKLRAFGATPPSSITGETKEARARQSIRMSAADHVGHRADNYARWVNFPWSVIEEGGQKSAGAWTKGDAARLDAFVRRAHAQQLWIRFYTLDGFAPEQDLGFTASYNFGTLGTVRDRWRAAIAAGVDFVATDQYEAFSAVRRAIPAR